MNNFGPLGEFIELQAELRKSYACNAAGVRQKDKNNEAEHLIYMQQAEYKNLRQRHPEGRPIGHYRQSMMYAPANLFSEDEPSTTKTTWTRSPGKLRRMWTRFTAWIATDKPFLIE